ncbi:hypothetical protein QO002_004410 [Pararhizobium capsulatum DSM 1112]|uniref:TfuA-like core domain-containing protein n=1 Tax=Pararhizobium capsulatum DSM 1112 TaxID=1121113 RepID=A0ABU0BVD8_9HYPH|nr:TfuA-like protein [Pararhizobium capsulatum]MDQ0322204.1 hypothetical protein [Pararhizobium capsulatum DSM 1112]
MAGSDTQGPLLVFLGPTLRLADAREILDAVYLQPAGQGDILLAAHAFRPRAMLLIDGQFEHRPAARHKEILWAMAQGIVMVGAASMGALRAAELAPCGMVGVGLVYRWYRRWPLAPDDAVAIQSAPAELGFMPLTDALIDLQRTFAMLMRRGLISWKERQALAAIARTTDFRQRTLENAFSEVGLLAERCAGLRSQIIHQKAVDAIQSLRLLPDIVKRRQGSRSLQQWRVTNTMLRDLEAANIDISLIHKY